MLPATANHIIYPETSSMDVVSQKIPMSDQVAMPPTMDEFVTLEPVTPVQVVEYLLETEKPISSTEYANLVQLVFNKTIDLLSAVHN